MPLTELRPADIGTLASFILTALIYLRARKRWIKVLATVASVAFLCASFLTRKDGEVPRQSVHASNGAVVNQAGRDLTINNQPSPVQTPQIAPQSVRLHDGKWAIKTGVSVQNPSDSPVYDVAVLIQISDADVSSHSVQLDAEAQPPPIYLSLHDITISPDRMRQNGRTAKGTQAISYIFYTIPPKSGRTLIISGTEPVPSSASLSIASFSWNPPQLLQSNGQVAIPFVAAMEAIDETSIYMWKK
jgi:hypothetical protein